MQADGEANLWDGEFPGDTQVLRTLRDDLREWDVRRDEARFGLRALEGEMNALNLPAHCWSRGVRERARFLERRYHQAQRAFQRALEILARFFATVKPAAKPVAAKAAESTLSTVLDKPRPMTYQQTADIHIVDGKTVTTVTQAPAAWFLERKIFPVDSIFRRQLVFDDGIPEEYAYCRTHEGRTLPPAGVIYISYSENEFMRLCRLEVETNSEHLLDGERLKLTYLPPTPP